MKAISWLGIVLAVLALAIPAAAQDEGWVESFFDVMVNEFGEVVGGGGSGGGAVTTDWYYYEIPTGGMSGSMTTPFSMTPGTRRSTSICT